jgi:hypothetical protein
MIIIIINYVNTIFYCYGERLSILKQLSLVTQANRLIKYKKREHKFPFKNHLLLEFIYPYIYFDTIALLRSLAAIGTRT